jgi:hypothetical protein
MGCSKKNARTDDAGCLSENLKPSFSHNDYNVSSENQKYQDLMNLFMKDNSGLEHGPDAFKHSEFAATGFVPQKLWDHLFEMACYAAKNAAIFEEQN